MILNSLNTMVYALILRLWQLGSKEFKDISTPLNIDVPGMDYILHNKNTMQLYHTSANIYQLLIQIFSFYHNIYYAINNKIIGIHVIMFLVPSIVLVIICYFGFINPSWIISSKQQPHINLFKRYRKQLYWQK